MSSYPSELNRYGASPGYDPSAGVWDERTGTYRGAPPGGPIRPFAVGAATPYSAAQWLALAPAKRKGFRDRASYLKWWHRTVEPKLTKPKPKAAGQTTRTNPQTGQPEATAAVDNQTIAPKDPRQLALERQIAERERYSLGQAEAAAKIMAALSALQAGEPGQIRDAYQGAADRTVDYAGGMTGELGAQAGSAAQQAAAAIAAMGAPGTGITSEAPAIANTLNYTGGFLPGTNLAAEAANQMTGALTSNKAAIGRLAELGNQQLRDAAKEIEELRYKAIDLEGTIAGEKAKADLDEREMQLRERAQRVNEGQLKLSVAKSANERAEAMTDITGTIWLVNKKGQIYNTGKVAPGTRAYSELQEGEIAAAKGAQPNAALSAKYGFIVDSKGNFILGANGKKQPVAKSPGAAAKPPSVGTKGAARGRANTMAKTSLDQFFDRIGNKLAQEGGRNEAQTDAEYIRRLKQNRSTGIRYVMQSGAAKELRAIGYTEKQIKAWATGMVDRAFAAEGA